MKWANGILILLLAGAAFVAVEQRNELAALRREHGDLTAQYENLQKQLDAANAKQSSLSATEAEQQKKNAEELLRLRSEATQLRTKAAEAAKLRSENQQLKNTVAATATNSPANPDHATNSGNQFPRDSWKFSGYATPEATLVSAIWAMREGNPKAYWDSLSPDQQARTGKDWENKSDADVAAKHQQDVSGITGFQILNSQTISPDEVQLSVFIAGPDKTHQVSLKRVGDDWKFAGFVPPPK